MYKDTQNNRYICDIRINFIKKNCGLFWDLHLLDDIYGRELWVKKTINSELWHACAGPLVTLPQVGSLVYYFPQGHSEQVLFPHKLFFSFLFQLFLIY
ncbi:hypothetical protein HanRHA438_Chr05g0223251 [Helianthus annuus]|nr:putative auxin response factor [Helianthus annuus]KAJ0750178.1 putative auxin response factor [Helianthus annuus]KAJ0918894.1 hypothetical protein HanRHA438_Chr05g0223251 [Helianthus annuus]